MEYLLSALVLLPHLLLMGPLVHIYQLESYQSPGISARSARMPDRSTGACWFLGRCPWP